MRKIKTIHSFYVLLVSMYMLASFQSVQANVGGPDDIPFKGTWEDDRKMFSKPISGVAFTDKAYIVLGYPANDVVVTITKDGDEVEQVTLRKKKILSAKFFDLRTHGTGEYRIDVSDRQGNHIWTDVLVE